MVGERGIFGSKRSSVSLIVVDGVWKCSAFVPIETNVIEEREAWGQRKVSRDTNLSEATGCS